MELEIRNVDLTPDSVPVDHRAADFEAFATSFDGYAHWGDRCAALAEAVAEGYRENGSLPDSLSDLRACLFYEQQKWHWQTGEPDDVSSAYLQALLDAIRDAAGL